MPLHLVGYLLPELWIRHESYNYQNRSIGGARTNVLSQVARKRRGNRRRKKLSCATVRASLRFMRTIRWLSWRESCESNRDSEKFNVAQVSQERINTNHFHSLLLCHEWRCPLFLSLLLWTLWLYRKEKKKREKGKERNRAKRMTVRNTKTGLVIVQTLEKPTLCCRVCSVCTAVNTLYYHEYRIFLRIRQASTSSVHVYTYCH